MISNIIRVGICLLIPFLFTACKTNLLAIGATSTEDISSRDDVSHRQLNVPEWASEITISADIEYGDIYFAVSSGGEISYPFNESLVNCVGSALSSNNTSSSCVIEKPKSGVWNVAFYGLDPENKFTLEVVGEMDWSWKYEVVSDAGDIVRDKVTGLEWKRCSVGETWNNNNQTCAGTAIRVYGHEAQGYTAAGGFRIPTVEELHSLVYCRPGSPGFFIEANKECDNGNVGYSTVVGIFPYTPSYNEYSDKKYWTSSKNENPKYSCTGQDRLNCLKTLHFSGGNISANDPVWGGYQNRVRLVRN